jgi:hypothetical protein
MRHIYRTILTVCLVAMYSAVFSQGLLSKHVSVSVTRKPLGEVLKLIGRQGNFYFSYNSNTVIEETLITLSIKDKPVRLVLNQLFDNSYEFKETESHIIIQYQSGAFWYASGYIKDGVTGDNIAFATVYDKNQFVSTMTNESGYFKLKLKDRNTPATLHVSKSWYNDTMIVVNPNSTKELAVSIIPQPVQLDSIVITQRNGVERNWFGRLFLSSKQRAQGINLSKYLADKPYQASVIPGVGTHGKMSGQAVNDFSFNLLGGYSGGVNGFEIAGVFNINKTNVTGAQVGGLFNLAGGKVHGLQIAGAYNHVLKASEGWQFAGLANFVNNSLVGVQGAGAYNHVWGKTTGVQVSGIANMAKDTMEGAQIAGTVNLANSHVSGVQVGGTANFVRRNIEGTQVAGMVNLAGEDVDGVQIAGMCNFTRQTMKGTQVSAFMNYAKHVKGVQVGIVNVADTSSGVSIGFFNFVLKGYHKLSISTNEVTNLNFAGKFGNRNLYTILSFGANIGKEAYTFGYGWGAQIKLYKRLSLNPELVLNQLYLGDWDFVNGLTRFDLALNYKLNNYFTIYAGPSYSFAYIDQVNYPGNFRNDIATTGVFNSKHGQYTNSWLGWHAGISIF